MAVYWQPGSGAYLPTQGDPSGGRRGGVAASPLRPGYPAVTLPHAVAAAQLARYAMPGAVPQPRPSFAAAAVAAAGGYPSQPAFQADPRNPRHPLRTPYPFNLQDGVQLLTGQNSLLAQGAAAALSSIVAPDVSRVRQRPVVDSRGPSGPPQGGPTAPLTIETREPKESAGYQPQVEAISPTPEDRPAERDDIKSTKDHLLQKIAKVDREIAKAESQIAKLKKKQEELEDAANKPSTDSASEDEKPNQSIAQNVYSENRRKASQSHAMLNKFCPGNLLPLYNQPSDTEVYNKNKKEYTVFKKQLVEYFKRKNEEQESRDRHLTLTYCQLSSKWNNKVDRCENNKKRRMEEAKSREMYEKLFPELRKQREDKERNERLGTRGTVRSDQEFQDVIDRIQEHEVSELEEKKMHSYAVVPPPLLPPEDRKRKYINNNGLMADPLLVYNERKFVNMWTDSEKETFKEKYLQHPKNFFMIAQYLERKSVSDCVQYYYLSKKTENYKQMLRKSRPRGGNRTRRMQNPTGEVIAPNVPGVVTRRTVAGLQEKEGEGSKGTSRSNTPQPNNKEKDSDETTNGDKDSGGRPKRGANKKVEAAESSDDEESNQAVKCGPFPCFVCKTTVDRSRPVNKANAAQLGVREEDITADSRVCQTCWCKTLKTKCQLLSCSTPGKNKKLRHLPAKWKELSPALKETLSNELQIPEGTKQVCTTCFGRINKRINQAQEDEVPARDTNSSNSRDTKETYKVGDVIWSNEEVTLLEMALRELGTDWAKIASKVPDKKASECKKFFYAHRKKLGLNEMVADYKKSVGASNGDKPSLSSDEEYSTSSCDDENDKHNDKKTDGKSDEKLCVSSSDVGKTVGGGTTHSTTQLTTTTTLSAGGKKEDGYDSAATVSADETHEQDKKLHPPPPHSQVMVTTAPGGATVVTVGLPMAAPANMKPMSIANNIVSSASSAGAFLPPGVVVSTGMMNAGPPPVVPVTKTIYVKDIMNTVIDESFRPNAHQNRTNEVSTIKDLLKDPHSTMSLPPGLMKPPPADLEVKPVPAPAAAHGAPQPPLGGAGEASGVVEDSGVLNLTTTKRDRTTPAPYPGLSEPVFKSTYVERGHHPGPSTHPISRGEKPPEAHCESKKTTHRETMDLDNRKLTEFSKNESSSSNHVSNRQEIMSSPYQHIKPGHKLEGGSITHGRPIPQHPQHPSTPRSSNYHPTQIKNLARGGSLVSGTPVYTDNRQDSRSSQALDIIKKQQQQQQQQAPPSHQQSRYPPYAIRQPVHSEANSSRGSTSRHVIENDFLTAQSLPRKDTHDDIRAAPYSRNDHRAASDRDIQIVETHPRFEPRPNSMYGNPRAAHPYGAPFRTDPKADIPPRDPIRPDPRTETHDPRYQPDLRGRTGFPPGYPGSMSLPRDTRSRSPPRSVSGQRAMSSSGIMSRPGSITSGVPRSAADLAHRGQPEVSITKQTVNQLPSRPDYPNTNLVNFADIALQQPKMADLGRGGVSGVGSSSSNSLTVTRTDPTAAANQRLQAELVRSALAASTFKYSDPRYVAGLTREQQAVAGLSREQQAELFKQLQLGAEDKDKMRYDPRLPNNLNAEQVIEMIISSQIKNNLQQQQSNPHGLTPGLTTAYGQLAVNNLAAGALPRLDGKESPSKSASRSPLVKDSIDERMLMRTSPAGLPPNSMEHLEAMKKDSQRNRTSPYPMTPVSSADLQDYWRKGKFGGGVDPGAYMARPPSGSGSLPRPGSGGMPAPPSLATSDERQIIRVAQNASPRSDKGSVSGRPAVEAISPPTSDPSRSTPNYSYQDVRYNRRKPNEIDQAAVQSSGAVFDYVKGKIAETMKTLDPRSVGGVGPTNPSMGPPNKRPLEGGPPPMGGNQGPTDLSAESPRKRHKPDDGAPDLPDSPGSGEMVIDESARPDSAHSQKTTSPAPHPNDYSNYRGPPPPGSSMPPRSSPSGGPPIPRPLPPSTSAGGVPPPGTRYEPLSDDD